MGKIIATARDGNVEFSWQISPIRVSSCLGDRIETDQIIESIAQFSGIHHFLVINSC